MPRYATIRMPDAAAAALSPESLQAVLELAGPASLPRQRWFAAKARTIRHVHLQDVVPLGDAPYPLAIVLIRCDYAEGPAETYQLLLVVREAENDVVPPGAIVCLHTMDGDHWLCDAIADPHACLSLLRLLTLGGESAGRQGKLRTTATADLPEDTVPAAEVHLVGAEQSNSSVIIGSRHILKLYRKLETGLNPDLELSRYLTLQAHCPHVPAFCGSLEYVAGGEPTALAIVQRFIESQGDGWHDALQAIGGYLDSPYAAALQSYAERVRALGRVTADTHAALAADTEPMLAPEAVRSDDLEHWQQAWRSHWQPVARLLAAQGEDVATLEAAIGRFIASVASIRQGGQKIRVHGDYHLGQVLRTADGWVLLDFEGEPARPLAERRAKQTPLKDVAGMLRSFSYAAYTGLLERAQGGRARWQQLEPLAQHWEHTARIAFLQGYESVLGTSALLPPAGAERQGLLGLFELDKAIYELDYELNNRPDWVRIPLSGIRRLTEHF